MLPPAAPSSSSSSSCVNLINKIVTTLLLLSFHRFRGVRSTTFIIGNSCGYTIWPGILSNAGVPLLANGGFTLAPGQSMSIDTPAGWSGRLWGRTGCNFTSSSSTGGASSVACASGDCGGRLECEGTGATPPVTLVEFTLQGGAGGSNQDYYDVSLVDGFNLPVTVVPQAAESGTCGVAGCSADINAACPAQLRVLAEGGGGVVSCKSACLAFGEAQYCCDGAYANPDTCQPTDYSKIFKAACPHAYSYAYDDPTSTFTCIAPTYVIDFCPAGTPSSSSQKTSTTTSGPASGTPATSTTSDSTTMPGSQQAWGTSSGHVAATWRGAMATLAVGQVVLALLLPLWSRRC